MTRTAAAQMLGLKDRGHLLAGAIADIAVYDVQQNKEKMFRSAALVFKNGDLVVKSGDVQIRKKATTQIMQPPFDAQIRRDVQHYYDQFYNLKLHHFEVENVSASQLDEERFATHACGKPYEVLNER
jgi:formylmethanofuran dehydrogenase subunit A